MGKPAQSGHTSGMTHNKTNASFKWGRMFHLLDYHHWYYVKKVLANKKRREGSNATEINSETNANFDPKKCCMEGPLEKAQLHVNKLMLQDHTTSSNLSTENSASPSSPGTTSSPVLSSSPSTKRSRATRIKKMIAREVTKRRGRHRRSSTCPVSSELVGTNPILNHLESSNDGNVEIENVEILRHNMNEGENICGLCSTMKIECQLGDKKEVGKQGELSLNHMNMILHENPDDSLHQLHFCKNIRRSVSLEQSTEFLDVMDVMSMNKRFFLRILDDPSSSMNSFLANQVETSAKRKPLTKSGTFPVNDSSCTRDCPFDVAKLNQKSFNKESCQKYTMLEKTNILNNDGQVPRIRFKDLRQKIKHVITESKKDRHIIAMDAVLHKVPYGQKVPEESKKDIPCLSTCEGNFSFSPESNKDIKPYKRRSPSLDESLDRYCNLFETTSSSKEIKTDTHIKSRLRVTDHCSNGSEQKRLGRIFSFPDLQLFFSNQYENYGGDISLRTPNRRIMSFNEAMVQELLDNDFEYSYRLNTGDKNSAKEDLNEDDGVMNMVNSMSFDNKENSVEDKSNKIVSNSISFEVLSDDNDDDATTQHVLMPNKESVTTSICEDDVDILQETSIDGLGSTHPEVNSKLEESFSDSPTFSCIKIDEDGVKNSFEHISLSLHRVQVESDDIKEFNYVKDILQLSGYLSTELHGTWYSAEQPLDPSMFVEFESCSLVEPKFSAIKEGSYNNHLLLFDLINETLLAIYERSVSYWCAPLSSCSRTHPMPKGYRILDEVWVYIKWCMCCSKPRLDPSLDYITERDLAKDDKWMNLQFDAECVGLEVEELIFEDLLHEVTS